MIVWRAVHPAARDDHACHRAVADGQLDVDVPYRERRDEIGALARSIAVFQDAMRHNEELNRTVRDDAEAREQRQEQIAARDRALLRATSKRRCAS